MLFEFCKDCLDDTPIKKCRECPNMTTLVGYIENAESDYNSNGDIIPDSCSNWKRHIVDNGYNADWKCKKCGYVVKTDFPPMKCPNCSRIYER